MGLYCMGAGQNGFPDNNILTHKKSGILRGEIVFEFQADEQQEMKTSGGSKKKDGPSVRMVRRSYEIMVC
ncbi:MAG: hypothetical protein N2B58_00625 [Desulfobacterales bacterium]